MDDDRLAALVENIYDLALEPDQWPTLLGRLAGAFGSAAGSLMLQNMETGGGGGLTLGLHPDAPTQYFSYYSTLNPLRRYENPRALFRSFTPTVTVDEESMPKRELMETEFYVDFLKRVHIHSVMTIGLWVRNTPQVEFTGLDFYRPAGRPGFDADVVALAEALHPHLIRAFRLGLKVAERGEITAGLSNALDRSPYGLFVLAADGRIRHANQAAERQLKAPGGLRSLAGRLAAPFADDSRRLAALVAAATAAAGERTGGSMAVRRPDGRAPLSVVVAPTGETRLALFQSGPGAIICVTDPEAATSVSEAALREVFGLTPAQVKVAMAVMDGRSPRQAGEAMGLSFYTVRAHLAQIFEKTGARRQSELVALLTRALGPI